MEATHKPKTVITMGFNKQAPHSSISTPRQPRWDCFGLFKSNSVSQEQIKKREEVINEMDKRKLKQTLEKAHHNKSQLNLFGQDIPDSVSTNIKLLERRDARLTSTYGSVVEEKRIPQKISKLGWLFYNRFNKKK